MSEYTDEQKPIRIDHDMVDGPRGKRPRHMIRLERDGERSNTDDREAGSEDR